MAAPSFFTILGGLIAFAAAVFGIGHWKGRHESEADQRESAITENTNAIEKNTESINELEGSVESLQHRVDAHAQETQSSLDRVETAMNVVLDLVHDEALDADDCGRDDCPRCSSGTVDLDD